MLFYRFNGITIFPRLKDKRFTGYYIFVPPKTWGELEESKWQDLESVTWCKLNCYTVE